MRKLVIIVCVLFLFHFSVPSYSSGESDLYYTMQIDDLIKASPDAHLHARLCIAGVVMSRPTHEKDGDSHIKLGDGRGNSTGNGIDRDHTIILEIIPQYPVLLPSKGQVITACGIVRYDGWHKWWELHPLLQWDTAATLKGRKGERK